MNELHEEVFEYLDSSNC